MKIFVSRLFLLFILFLVVSCSKDEQEGLDSLRGQWQIVKILSIYELNNNEEERVEEEGNLGTFTFGEELVDFEFTRNDTVYSGKEIWFYESVRVNEGFITVPENTLTIDNLSVFDVLYEDGTKNSEKNATEMTLTQDSDVDSNIFLQFVLEKL